MFVLPNCHVLSFLLNLVMINVGFPSLYKSDIELTVWQGEHGG